MYQTPKSLKFSEGGSPDPSTVVIRSLLRLLLSCTFSFLFLFSSCRKVFRPAAACHQVTHHVRHHVTHHVTQSHDTGAPSRLRLCATASSTRLIYDCIEQPCTNVSAYNTRRYHLCEIILTTLPGTLFLSHP